MTARTSIGVVAPGLLFGAMAATRAQEQYLVALERRIEPRVCLWAVRAATRQGARADAGTNAPIVQTTTDRPAARRSGMRSV